MLACSRSAEERLRAKEDNAVTVIAPLLLREEQDSESGEEDSKLLLDASPSLLGSRTPSGQPQGNSRTVSRASHTADPLRTVSTDSAVEMSLNRR